jgi:WD40 repeat protein
MARVFISHSSRDNESAAQIKTWLAEQGFETPFLDYDKHAGIPPGADWEKTLYLEIELSEAVVIIQTPNWLDSKWCFAEFTQARALGKSIFPIIETPTGDTLISSDIQALDLSKDREGGLEQLSSQLTQIALDAQGGFGWDAIRPPYPGLLAFQEEDAALYFGRDDDIRRLIERLDARRAQGGSKLIALLGSSGSGKSSLLRAGVIPRLKRAGRNWVVLPTMRPQVRPVDEFARCLAVAYGGDADWRKLREALNADNLAQSLSDIANDLRMRASANEAQILLSIDHGEELFGAADPDQARRFCEILNVALSSDLPFIAVIAMRSDYLGLLQSAEHLTARFEEFSLGPLPLARIAQIIEGPARVAGLGIDEAFVHQAVKDAKTEDALPLLAFALRELYDSAATDNYLSLAEYNALGDVKEGLTPLENAVRKAADNVLAETRPSDKELTALREAFVPAMVRVNDQGEYVRQPARWNNLPSEAHTLLERLAKARLLIVSQEDGERMVEVAHEALLRKWPRLRTWLDDAREFLAGKQQLQQDLHDWEQAAEEDKDAALLSGLKLNRAHGWFLERPHQLNTQERTLIKASIDHAEAEEVRRKADQTRKLLDAEALAEANRNTARRTKLGLVIAMILALLAGGAGLYAHQQTIAAEVQASLADEQRELAEVAKREAEETKLEVEKQLARSEQLLYVNRIKSAQREWEAKNAVAAIENLAATSENSRNWEYNYLRALFLANRKELPGHPDSTNSFPTTLAFSPDGNRILRADYGETLTLADAQKGMVVSSFKGYRATFSRDGTRIVSVRRASGTAHDTLELRDAYKGKVLSTFQGQAGKVKSIVFSPDGKRIVTGGRDGVKVWNVALGVEEVLLIGDRSASGVQSVDYSFDGNWIVGGGNLGITVWDARSGAENPAFSRNSYAANAVAFSPDGMRIVSGGSDGIKLWKVATGIEQRSLIKERSAINAVAFNIDGDRIVGGGKGRTVWLWDSLTGERIETFKGHNYEVLAVAFSPDGRQIVSAAGKNYRDEYTLWTVSEQRPITDDDYSSVTAAAFSPKGDRIATGAWDNQLRLWDARGAQEMEFSLGAAGGDLILSLAFSPDGKQIITGSRPGGINSGSPTVRIWSAKDGTEALTLQGAPSLHCASVAFSPRGDQIAAGCWDGRAGKGWFHLWDSAGNPGLTLEESFDAWAFHPAGGRIVSSDRSGMLKLWDTSSGEEIATFKGHPGGVSAVAFSPDGVRIVSGGRNGTLKVWDLGNGEEQLAAKAGKEPLTAVAFSPDGLRLASSSNDETVRLWDAGTGDEMLSFKGQPNTGSAIIAFSPDGFQLISGGSDGIKLWEAPRPTSD